MVAVASSAREILYPVRSRTISICYVCWCLTVALFTLYYTPSTRIASKLLLVMPISGLLTAAFLPSVWNTHHQLISEVVSTVNASIFPWARLGLGIGTTFLILWIRCALFPFVFASVQDISFYFNATRLTCFHTSLLLTGFYKLAAPMPWKLKVVLGLSQLAIGTYAWASYAHPYPSLALYTDQ